MLSPSERDFLKDAYNTCGPLLAYKTNFLSHSAPFTYLGFANFADDYITFVDNIEKHNIECSIYQ